MAVASLLLRDVYAGRHGFALDRVRYKIGRQGLLNSVSFGLRFHSSKRS